MRHTGVFLLIALAGAFLDLLTKSLVFRHVGELGEVVVLDGLLNFGRTENKGVIFGLGTHAPTAWLVISILAVPAILAIFFSVKKPRWPMTIALGLILAGTIGNMYDRVTAGAVRDFIKFYYVRADGTYAVWPLFNLADSCICVGVFLLSVEMLFFDDPKKKKKIPPPAAAPVAAPGVSVDVRVNADEPGPQNPLPQNPQPPSP